MKRAKKTVVAQEQQEIRIGSRQPNAVVLTELLEVGRLTLGMRIGILSRVIGERYEILHVAAPTVYGLAAGTSFDLGETYCRETLRANGPVGFECAHLSHWANHPAYQKFKLESYFGTPLVVDGETYGTLNFSDPDPRPELFTDSDYDLVDRLAVDVGRLIERARKEG